MAKPPHRVLRILLRVFSILIAIGSLLMILSGKPLVTRMFLRPPEAEISTLLLFMLKEMGGLALMLSILLFFASRDPVRNIAIIDAFIVGLFVLAATPLLSWWMLPIREIYPGYLVWGRSVARLVLAAVFYLLRPQGGYAEVWRA